VQVKEDEMGRARSTHGKKKKKNACEVLVGKPEEREH
jgi:hypothetical protein